MKKLLLSLWILALTSMGYALPVFNPADPGLLTTGVIWNDCCGDPCGLWCDNFSFRVGFYGDYIFNRHLRNRKASNKADISRTEVMTNAALLVLNFANQIDLFATLGATKICQEGNLIAFAPGFGLPNRKIYLETDTAFSWSVGARGILYQCRCLTIGVEGQYFATSPKFNSFHQEAQPLGYQLEDQEFKYRDWQVALGAAYRINIVRYNTAVVPYAAVRWARACVDADDATNLDDPPGVIRVSDQEEVRLWGWAFGLTLVGCDKWSVTAEGRFANELAAHINTQFRF